MKRIGIKELVQKLPVNFLELGIEERSFLGQFLSERKKYYKDEEKSLEDFRNIYNGLIKSKKLPQVFKYLNYNKGKQRSS